jgi:hypothetical protein
MSIKRSVFEGFILESNDQKRTVDITSGAIVFEYFEDIFSPTITAKVKVVNTGNVIPSEKNSDGVKQSIYNGLPLRGGERLSIKISGNSEKNPGLDFSKKVEDYFYVSSITDVISETQKESFTLHLVSREAITNETSRIPKKYPTSSSIDTSVRKILTEYLKTNKFGIIDKTSNKYGFIGNMRKPFTILIWLASKSVPVSSGDGTAGFLFYQTVDGFQFRSIDGLIDQEPKAIYTYSEATVTYDSENTKNDNDFKILNYIVDRNQNLIEKLRTGTYSSQRLFFNPLDFNFSNSVFKLSDYIKKTNNLGSEIKLPKISNSSNIGLGDIPTRIMSQIIDIGIMDPDVSTKPNADPGKYQSQALMRYNILFTQSLSIIVPSNTNLRAGDIIECNFPKISESDSKEYDPETSGLYMIKELCHHFDVERSYTSMKLVRDTFGPKSNTKK